jgi:hypothetical protein
MAVSLLTRLVKGGRLLFSRLREKPEVKVDEHNLEHMLLYHGLVGTSPENQRDFRDVRADIRAAINQRSSLQLGIALKLPPLWWEDKLNSIVADLPESSQAVALDLLLPDDSDHALDPESNPVKHPDWRVRANAALIISCLHAADRAATVLGDMLSDSTPTGKSAACHVAYALGKLRSHAARLALSEHRRAEDPWLRVDIAGALALSEFDSVAKELSSMLLEERDMRDYMAVAIAKQHRPELFLESANQTIRDGGLVLISGIVEAAEHSFPDTLVFDTGVYQLLEGLIRQSLSEKSPLSLMASLSVLNSAKRYNSSATRTENGRKITVREKLPSTIEEAVRRFEVELKAVEIRRAVFDKLKTLTAEDGREDFQKAELVASIKIAGMLEIGETAELLLPCLKKSYEFRDAVVETLGMLHQPESVQPLIQFAKTLVNVDQRNMTAKSKQPVQEEDAGLANTYWYILKALGGIPTKESADFLLAAIDDYAPDKRAESMNSLVQVLSSRPDLKLERDVDAILTSGLRDPAPMMQIKAIAGAAKLNRVRLIDEIVRLIDANENSVSKEAFSSLAQLSGQGSEKDVLISLAQKLKTTREAYKRRKIEELLRR